jgi:hypothetical protein
MSQTTDVKDIINLIQGLDNESSFNIFIPSLQKEVKFKQLTTEQLKRILKTVVDSPVYNTEFIKTFNSIIKENCLDKEISIDSLTIFDKLLIIFKTKIESISSEFNFTFTDEEIQNNNLKEKNKIVNIETHFKDFLEKNINFETQVIEHNNSTVTCNLPTIFTENKLEQELHKNIKIEVTTPEELRAIVGETFINEVTKFITDISVNGSSIDLLKLSFKNRISVVENLPTQIINKVIKYIENYRETIKPLLTCKVKVETTQQTTVEIEKEIPLDASFFNM